MIIGLTREQVRRLRELAKEPMIPLESDRTLLNFLADEGENPKFHCGDCGFWHRSHECSVANNDEDYG